MKSLTVFIQTAFMREKETNTIAMSQIRLQIWTRAKKLNTYYLI